MGAATARIGAATACRVIRVRAVVYLRVYGTTGTGGMDHARALEVSRPSRGCNSGHAMVDRDKL